MLSKDVFKAVKRLELVARRAVNDQLAGQYQSVFKGRGMDFVDVREYQAGDDIRIIDWNVSARMDALHVKQFVEERELTAILVVDLSASQSFGTVRRLKREIAAEIAALLAFAAIKNNDRVGFLGFTDVIEKYIPAKKGRKHVLRVITEILQASGRSQRTDISQALEYLARVQKKKAVVFLISDFLDDGYDRALGIASRRHEIVPIVIRDPMEGQLPSMGLAYLQDPETGASILIDTSDRAVRDAYLSAVEGMSQRREKSFRKLGLDTLELKGGEDYVRPLVSYFQRQQRRV